MKMLLNVSHLDYSFHTISGKYQVLSDISFSVAKGEFISIIGPKGCGKSTLLSVISGILPVSSGTIDRKINNIGYLVQKENLFEWRNCHTDSDIVTETYGMTAFSSPKNIFPYNCIEKRAELILSLAMEPDLVILDEPFNTLDYATRLDVGYSIRNLIKTYEKGGILVTNDLAEAIALSDKIIIMTPYPGRIKNIIDIKLTSVNSSPIDARNAPEFKDYFNKVWSVLIEH
ncbi:MAG: ATP-binding cassette domain-containing protein [Lachnospiraceae bacterium]